MFGSTFYNLGEFDSLIDNFVSIRKLGTNSKLITKHFGGDSRTQNRLS
jgi:hypothetical protein